MEHHMKFGMPMLKPFVSEKMGIAIYLLMALFFQLSAAIYLGAMPEIMGEDALTRYDVPMLLYCNLGGLAMWFPMLFRMKFRFTNQMLLIGSALGIIVCYLLMMWLEQFGRQALPAMWLVCFIEGALKLEGTFECMSVIQLWITPKRNFAVFFPVLHIILMGAIQANSILVKYLAYYAHYWHMNYLVIGLMILIILFQWFCCRPFRPMLVPLKGIDWLGMMLWGAFFGQIAWIFNYGDWVQWQVSTEWCIVVGTALLTLVLSLVRMKVLPQPFISPSVFKTRFYMPILIITILVEMLMGTEHALEEVYIEEVMGWSSMQSISINWMKLVGCIIGALIALWWMGMNSWNYFRLYTFGIFLAVLYHAGYYFQMTTDILPSTLWPSALLCGMATSILSATMLVILNGMFDFEHFFQGLGIFQFIHVTVGGAIGAAFYNTLLGRFVPDNLSRYSLPFDGMMQSVMEISIKQCFGVCLMIGVLLLIFCLFYKHPVRRHLQKVPFWSIFGRSIKKSYRSTC